MIKTLEEVEETLTNMDDDRLAHIKRFVDRIEKQREDAKRFPIKTKFYMHADRDTNFELGSKLGLDDTQLATFVDTGYEVVFDIEIDKYGKALVTAIYGVELESPFRL